VLLAASNEGYQESDSVGLPKAPPHLRAASAPRLGDFAGADRGNAVRVFDRALTVAWAASQLQRILNTAPTAAETVLGALKEMFEPRATSFVDAAKITALSRGKGRGSTNFAESQPTAWSCRSSRPNDVPFMSKEYGQAHIY